MSNVNYNILTKTKIIFVSNFVIKFIYFIILINIIKSQCTFDTPIFKDGQCKLDYCSKLQYKNKECQIANEIVKTQWLSNIIRIGDLDFRYINFATFSNGDMIVETSACPSNETRMFYGLDTDGRGLFNSNSGTRKTPYYIIEANDQPGNTPRSRYEAENVIVTINEGTDKGKEYLVTFPKTTQYIELYLFDENVINQKQFKTLFGNEMENFRGSAFTYILNNVNYVIIAYKTSRTSTNYFKVKRLNFKSKEFSGTNPVVEEFTTEANPKVSISCFPTVSNYIICSYIEPITKDFITTNSFTIIALNTELKKQGILTFSNEVNSDASVFVKCVHLKEEAGAFVYYNANNYPFFLFKKFNKITKVFDEYLSLSYVELTKYSNNNYCLKNDLIKITDTKLCFTATSSANDTLNIMLINIFESNNVFVRYYQIRFFKLNKYKILLDMRGSLYKNFIATAFSYCRQEVCYNDKEGDHYAGLILFSYPSQENSELNIINYLFDNNDIKISNIIVNFKNNLIIDNNIFGFIYYGIKIKENKCDIIDIMKYDTEEKIQINETVANEKVRLIFNAPTEIMSCEIKYTYIITEPKYEDYNKYVDVEDNSFGSINEYYYNSQTDKYEGKINTYEIIIDQDFEIECKGNCELCLKNDTNFCVTCEFNYTINENNYKICLVQEKKEEEEEEEDEKNPGEDGVDTDKNNKETKDKQEEDKKEEKKSEEGKNNINNDDNNIINDNNNNNIINDNINNNNNTQDDNNSSNNFLNKIRGAGEELNNRVQPFFSRVRHIFDSGNSSDDGSDKSSDSGGPIFNIRLFRRRRTNSDDSSNNNNSINNINININSNNNNIRIQDLEEDLLLDDLLNNESINKQDSQAILNYLPNSVIKEVKKNGDNNNTKCVICLSDFQVGDNVSTLPCLHIFHNDCLEKWINQQKWCPICKFDISLNSLLSKNNENF